MTKQFRPDYSRESGTIDFSDQYSNEEGRRVDLFGELKQHLTNMLSAAPMRHGITQVVLLGERATNKDIESTYSGSAIETRRMWEGLLPVAEWNRASGPSLCTPATKKGTESTCSERAIQTLQMCEGLLPICGMEPCES